MKTSAILLREAWLELQAGFRSGVVALTFIGLVGYLLMVLTNAGYLQQMGAVDVPRNAPSLVYLMSSGDTFFLFFAWAWVFAQPIVRDRQALLHEVVLTAPLSLRTLLAGRFLGALAVALLLGISQMAGFLLSPLLEVAGLVPAGAIAPTPWAALAWSLLIFVLPTAAGTGALYYCAALWTRGSSGPFALSALIILIWMFAMVIMSEGGILVEWSVVLDPSLFADVDRLNKSWTPAEKASILYPITTPFLLNRLVWFVLPLVLLAVAVCKCTREHLVLERPLKKARGLRVSTPPQRHVQATGFAAPACNWWHAFLAETRWQHALVWRSRSVMVVLLGMVVLGVAAGYVHGVNNIDGPYEARPEYMWLVLNKAVYLVFAFIIAAATGAIIRRDQRAGIGEMLDAAPSPPGVVFGGRLLVICTLTLALVLTPAVALMVLTALSQPQAFSVITPVLFQLAVYGPALFEIVIFTMLVHYLIRNSGAAYAASMLATFIFIVNHEAELIDFPPLEFGIPVDMHFSVLTGWPMWLERLLISDLYKFTLMALVIALAALVQMRGLDSRLARGAETLRTRLFSPWGGVLAGALATAMLLYQVMDGQLRELGGYQSRTAQLDEDAAWERRWVPLAGTFVVAGGELVIDIDTSAQQIQGSWRIDDVRSTSGLLHLELPHALTLGTVTVAGASVTPELLDDHAAIPLGDCAASGCDVELNFMTMPRGWNAEGDPRWLSAAGIWANAEQLAPMLGLDRDRRLLAPIERSLRALPEPVPELTRDSRAAVNGIAPQGNWQVSIRINSQPYLNTRIDGNLHFVVQQALHAVPVAIGDYQVVADQTREVQAQTVADDAHKMQLCVERRLGIASPLSVIAQLPRGMGPSTIGHGTLLLAEEPHWDAASGGNGHWRRQMEIGTLLARQVLQQRTALRQGDGARLLTEGVAGAIGHLCVGDASGTAVLHMLLARASERIAQGLGTAGNPVSEIAHDNPDAWFAQYVAIASIPWVAQLGPEQFQQLTGVLATGTQIEAALADMLGREGAARVLGMPLASDLTLAEADAAQSVEIMRQIWARGGWTELPSSSDVLVLQPGKQTLAISTLRVGELSAERLRAVIQGSLLLDDWPAYERTPEDNDWE